MEKKIIVAKVLKKISRNSVKAAVNSRCSMFLHQPKQPTNIKNFCK
ncbi:MAG: cyclic lactone autoinducer peptide [Pseudobutyrivibrio sp.]|nr:cyclic lactone autoinducer peptide [Pseudobutyrivibrio sp.]